MGGIRGARQLLNGTSTSNKVVTSALVSRGDLVLFDRNNHKSNHQGALVLDLRPTEEFAAGHITGARQLLRDQIDKAGETLKKYREKPVVHDGPPAAEVSFSKAEVSFSKVVLPPC